jgi:hypothetical protein
LSDKTPKKVILNITPQTNIRTTQNDRVFFRIPRAKLRPAGLKRLLRIERYNNYKVELLTEAKKKGFVVPAAGLSITFYIPCPESWPQKKKKAHHGKLHQSRPDLDKYIANITLTKRWVDFPQGWIECLIFPVDETIEIKEIPIK